jgi:hypothetical protein
MTSGRTAGKLGITLRDELFIALALLSFFFGLSTFLRLIDVFAMPKCLHVISSLSESDENARLSRKFDLIVCTAITGSSAIELLSESASEFELSEQALPQRSYGNVSSRYFSIRSSE